MFNKKIFIIATVVAMFAPFTALALNIEEIRPQTTAPVVSAKSVVAINQATGELLYEQNADLPWIPASLTKLVTALVVLDTNPQWNSICTVVPEDEVGGARLFTYSGAKYRMQDLLNASLVASANNATNTLARCTGLSREEFVSRMNKKAAQFGALRTKFVESTGIDIANTTTASDFAKIANAAFSTKSIRQVLQKKVVTVRTVASSPQKTHYLKTTNMLLSDRAVYALGGKTGYLDESLYNFAGSFKSKDGTFIVTVVLGSRAKAQSFSDTKGVLFAISDGSAGRALAANPQIPNRVLGAVQ